MIHNHSSSAVKLNYQKNKTELFNITVWLLRVGGFLSLRINHSISLYPLKFVIS